MTDPLAVMLEARSVALVGASPRPGSLGARMIAEVGRSPARPRVHLVNPRYDSIGDARCHPSLGALPEAVDLALFAVPDAALADAVAAGVAAGARSGVVFGTAVGVREQVAGIAGSRMPLCGAGCMGFVNVARGLRAIGYVEAGPLPAGPVALVTHSGSVFSALLRTRRAFGFTLAVSSGQELVTTAAEYARYALALPETRVLALVMETLRRGPLLRSVLADAAARDVPVVLLPAGLSGTGRSLVSAHSGALAAGSGAWEALASAYGVHLAGDLAELADTLELFCAGRRVRGRARGAPAPALASVHDSGFERAHVADVAAALGVPFAGISARTRARLTAILDPGLEPATRWTCGGPGATPRHCSLPRCRRSPTIPPSAWSRSPWTWCTSTTATTPTRAPCSRRPRGPPSRWWRWPRCPRRLTHVPPRSCGPPGFRCWSRPAAACWRCGTCWTTRTGPRLTAARRIPLTPAGGRAG